MKVLLTGATGNVGSHTLPQLLSRGHAVRCLVRPSRRNRRFALRFPAVEVHWGDVRDPDTLARAVSGMDAVLHLAAAIPPFSDDQPELAYLINVDGTANVIRACLAARPTPPRLLFTSTFAVHGYTLDRPPPRRVDDPLVATDPYSAHKIECERMVRESGLDHCILRLADVPILGARDPHPIMFEIGLDNRIESLHADDAGLAITNALDTPQVWGRVLFLGGGPSCQLTYREYLTRLLGAMGISPLPEEAFSDKPYATDWIDTDESEALLRYQRHTFDDIAAAVAASLGWRRRVVPLVGPLARSAILRLSPYYRPR
ncbi:MAG TPA: NAD-dependent epimerase/dehydratase family protein [Micromonosporaceae bacterium]|nr:NAD-dependent epimerase/dehydratase family protein [Micromonosporaceae bacterium]